ncbi:MAG: ParB/RepB/Spo0J family partition protein [Bacteroidetes bacterium]|nr:ParB/RepB/Spo0J family partition protein [Bacteroidota bacterium]MCL1968363.1 ParB/RepB/Spo0J family partition protein [Bacteroidota bacterium]
MEKKQPNRLGRGLGILLGDTEIPIAKDSILRVPSDANAMIRLDSIETNEEQPRKDFDENSLQKMALSIRSYGIIQPITVRPIQNGKYQIISGERRYRASLLAGLQEIPAFVRTVDEVSALQMALVENIQREDLNAIEVAVTYQRLLNECDLSHEELSVKVGKERATVTNYLRLLRLTKEAQQAIVEKKISMAHARTLVAVEDIELQKKILKDIINRQLSVRETEAIVKKLTAEVKLPKTKVKVMLPDEVMTFSRQLSDKLKSKVSIQKDITGKGKISISFTSNDELTHIIKSLS